MSTLTLERRDVLYCKKCGMPPEYCEYGPDFETHCNVWLHKNYPELHAKLEVLRNGNGVSSTKTKKQTEDSGDGDDSNGENAEATSMKPSRPWTTEERLLEFYKKYQPEKVGDVPGLLSKYSGKEDKLFEALVKKYGPEPNDPYFSSDDEDDSDDESDDDIEGGMADVSLSDKKKRRGAAAKKTSIVDTRVVIQKISRNKKKAVTIVVGMDTVPDIKLKDVAKAFSKRFAGSSSVKDTVGGTKEIIIQGDHMDDVALMVVDKFGVPAKSVFLDIDGEFIPYK